jgi:ubiquinone/menaquinone biosynthesis C-methylase UbiE
MIRDTWAWKSRYYDRWRNLPLIRRILKKETDNIRTILGQVKPFPGRVLDVGTGSGSSLESLPDDTQVIAIDRSRAMLRRIPGRERVRSVAGEGCRLPVFQGAFSMVTAVGVTEYMSDKEKFLREVRRVLRAPGFFLVTLSPGGILTALRRCLGTPLFIMREPDWERCAERAGFHLLERRRSLMQIQFLYRV